MRITIGAPRTAHRRRFPPAWPGGFDADAILIIGRMDVPPSAARQICINNLVVALKAANVWNNLDLLYVLAAHDAQAGRLNWKSTSFNLSVEAGSPTFVTDRGYLGNNGVLTTGFTPPGTNFTQNAAHFGAWIYDSSLMTVGLYPVIGQDAGPNTRMRVSPTTSSINMNSATGMAGTTHPHGHIVGTRTSSTISDSYKDGVNLGSSDTTSAAFHADTIRLFYEQGNFSVVGESIVHFGGSLTSTEVLAMYNAFRSYLTCIGAVGEGDFFGNGFYGDRYFGGRYF